MHAAAARSTNHHRSACMRDVKSSEKEEEEEEEEEGEEEEAECPAGSLTRTNEDLYATGAAHEERREGDVVGKLLSKPERTETSFSSHWFIQSDATLNTVSNSA